MVRTIVPNSDYSKNQNRIANSVDVEETVCNSGTALFAQVLGLVFQAERFKDQINTKSVNSAAVIEYIKRIISLETA